MQLYGNKFEALKEMGEFLEKNVDYHSVTLEQIRTLKVQLSYWRIWKWLKISIVKKENTRTKSSNNFIKPEYT